MSLSITIINEYPLHLILLSIVF